MELADTWTCGCGAENTGDIFADPCWKCGSGGRPVKIQSAAELGICPDCRASPGFHMINCPTHPLKK